LTKTDNTEFAQAADLLAPATGKKEVFLKTLKKKVTIKKINIGELADVTKAAKDDDIQQFIFLVLKGLVRPKLNIDQTRKLPMKVIMEIAGHIAKFSELDKDSVDEIRNLLATKA